LLVTSVQPVGTTVENFSLANVWGLGDSVGVGACVGSLLLPHAAADITSSSVSVLAASGFNSSARIEHPARQTRAGRVRAQSVLMAIRSAPTVSHLKGRDTPQLDALLQQDPVGNAYLRSELRMGMQSGEWLGVFDGDSLVATILAGPLAWPYIPGPEAASALAEALSGPAAPRMLVGPRPSVLALHHAFSPPRQARERRDPQPLLAVTRETLTPLPTAPVRLATAADLDALVVTSAAMHREEMGSDPLAGDATGWRARMSALIERGWSWVWTDRRRIVFKAELSAWNADVVQIQGVYTAPGYRGRGVATAGLGSMCAALLREVSMCSLYVNHYNEVALTVYRKLGFQPAGEFATVFY
jgi:uncharacterized protein